MHPDDPQKCVKVLRTDERRTVRMAKKGRIIPTAFRRVYDNNAHEMRVLEELERCLGSMMTRHFPRSYGMAATDIGPGLVTRFDA